MRAIVWSCLLIIGCGPLTHPINPTDPKTREIVEEPLNAKAVFAALSAKVPQRIRDTYRLARIVKQCGLRPEDEAKFDAAFPDALKTQRELTDADAQTLQEIK